MSDNASKGFNDPIIAPVVEDLWEPLTEPLRPIVTTHKSDYAPGETAVISGSGFTPGSEVVIQIADDPADPGDDQDVDVYEPIVVIVDENGAFRTTWFVPIDDDGSGGGKPDALNATLNLTAIGSDGQSATTTFTDALPPPIQTYFVPLPEDDLIAEFEAINASDVDANGFVRSLIAIAVAAPGTVIYYDHWEDGYETDVTRLPLGSTTSIWGDGNSTNDDPTGTLSSFITGLPAGDLFSGGESIILENPVQVPRDNSVFRFDGSDRILVSFPVAVSRAAFPTNNGQSNGFPGSLLAGGTEVFDSDTYGTSFVIPVGEDTANLSSTNPFERVTAHVMAAQDNTEVFFNGVSQGFINAGQTSVFEVNQGNTITTSDPVQVHLATGDVGSTYEMRWYQLTPRNQWSNDYYTPVGSGSDATQIWLYNPNDVPIVVTYQFGNGPGNAITSGTINVPANGVALSLDTPNNSGARFFTASGQEFFGITQTDSDGDGQIKDWGHPLISADQLTSQALVGLGYGNTNNDPTVASRSVVWVTPVADAYINIDYDGNGTIDDSILVTQLDNLRIQDNNTFSPTDSSENDQDMSGAIIFATTGAIGTGAPVDIAVAWGQDPSLSFSGDGAALDLGTIVPPLPVLEAGKSASLAVDNDADGKFDPGDTIEWTIIIQNIGRIDIAVSGYNVKDFITPLFANTSYVVGTTTYTTQNGTVSLLDDSGPNNGFPLDELGFLNTVSLLKNGGTHTFKFQTIIFDFDDLAPGTVDITNTGVATNNNDGKIDDFSATVPLNFDTSIDIEKFTNGQDADDPTGPEIAAGDAVTWTYEVSNTGDVWLSNITVTDDVLGPITNKVINGDGDEFLAPGEIWVYAATGVAQFGQYANVGTATGTPVYANSNTVVSSVEAPEDNDLSHYFGIQNPILMLLKEGIYTDVGGDGLNAGDTLDYTFTVTNKGNVSVTGVTINEVAFDLPGPIVITAPADVDLSPGEGATFTGQYVLTQADIDSFIADPIVDNIATATGLAPNGDPVVSNEDDATVLFPMPGLEIEKFTNGIDVATANNAVEIKAGETVTWTYNVANTGNVTFNQFMLIDDNGTADDDSDDLSFALQTNGTLVENGIIYEGGDDNNNQQLDAGEIWNLKAEGIAQNLSVSINFDESVISGKGDLVKDQYNSAEFGKLTIATPVNPYDAMIFDSANPTGDDWDLGTPTQPAGPGIGTDSGAGVGNITPQNNVLIISEDGDQSDPDDNASGGTLQFNFGETYGVNLDAIGLLDIDNNEAMVTVDSLLNNTLITSNAVEALGDNSFQMIELNGDWADQLDVNLVRSGAVTQLDYRRIYGNMATLSAQFGDNTFTSSDSSFYTNPYEDINAG